MSIQKCESSVPRRGRTSVGIACRSAAAAVFVIAVASISPGCQTARVVDPVTKTLGASDPDTQMNFWHTLAERPLASNDEAFHGLLLYIDEKDDATTYEQRVESLKSRKLIPQDFNLPADEAVKRGTVAVAIARLLDVKGGWAMHVFGNTPRYALRELQYLSILPYSSPQQTFSGAEFVGVIGAVEDYQRSKESPENTSTVTIPEVPAATPTGTPTGTPAGTPATRPATTPMPMPTPTPMPRP